MRLKQNIAGAAVVLGLAFAAGSANAMPIPLWNYSIDSGWANAMDQAGRSEGDAGSTLHGSSAGGLNSVSWGTNVGNGQSSLDIDANVSGILTTNGATEPGAALTHNNVIIGIGNGVALDKIDLVVNISLAPAPGVPTLIDTVTFNIDFFETPNSAPCDANSVSICDDQFLLLNPEDLTAQSFIIGNFKYTLSLELDMSGLTFFETLPNGTIRFLTAEGSNNSLLTNLRITAMEIPEPAPLALLGLSLIGLGAVRRRRKV